MHPTRHQQEQWGTSKCDGFPGHTEPAPGESSRPSVIKMAIVLSEANCELRYFIDILVCYMLVCLWFVGGIAFCEFRIVKSSVLTMLVTVD
jgi:hypothetical protein